MGPSVTHTLTLTPLLFVYLISPPAKCLYKRKVLGTAFGVWPELGGTSDSK